MRRVLSCKLKLSKRPSLLFKMSVIGQPFSIGSFLDSHLPTMNDEDAQALAALQVSGTLSERVPLRGMGLCPHCSQGFGSASLPIHVRRCRALLQSTTEEDEEQERSRPIRRKQVRSLVDLCLRFVTNHFESVCMDKIVAFPEAEAALIASMPSNLVHRMVVNLVKESKRMKMRSRESRAAIENLENALDGARKDVAQLESARDWAASSRARMAGQQQVAERLQRELDATKMALAFAEAENQRLKIQVESAEKKTLRLEAKINALNAEKTSLKNAAKEAQRREMDATRQLASRYKLSPNKTATTRRKLSCTRHDSVRGGSPFGRADGDSPVRKSPRHSSRNATRSTISTNRSPVIFRKRPRADGSKIPYPASAKCA